MKKVKNESDHRGHGGKREVTEKDWRKQVTRIVLSDEEIEEL